MTETKYKLLKGQNYSRYTQARVFWGVCVRACMCLSIDQFLHISIKKVEVLNECALFSPLGSN